MHHHQNPLELYLVRIVVPKLFQFPQHLDIMVLSAEHPENVFMTPFKLGTILLVENMM
jgi:hypothetical protein